MEKRIDTGMLCEGLYLTEHQHLNIYNWHYAFEEHDISFALN